MNKNKTLFLPLSPEECKNISIIKGYAALIVVLGHWVYIPNFWIIQTTALLIFTITSGFLTRLHYQADFSTHQYWKNKILRLCPHLATIYLFLFVVFLVREEKGIFSWITIVHLTGMSGFLNWFHIPPQSPYGEGMWFLTLLLLFYIVYPFINKMYKYSLFSLLFTTIGICCLFILHLYFPYSYSIWVTTAGYLAGLFIIQNKIKISVFYALTLTSIISVSMLIFHFVFHCDTINFWFILGLSTSLFLLCLTDIKTPLFFSKVGLWLSTFMLEIYLLHPYLQFSPTKNMTINLLLSFFILIAISFGVSKTSNVLWKKVAVVH